ncbi:uncharacterized protein L3040_007654 [Drepanopeziza brunnea f. sp. 'multigermtubi']|uniref:EKC/KEOPS complex subunit CGI121 n=1 Tax=Marssonina brunnea f. sp. multigermtubi (strain MB_m1) TaxID=1072389 RepID=K1WYZ3_MARBU|nr:uncharacterized protein MBM_03943 [Drepanopeziza brunnea f. sp. 'multigermtubi' MB_m1]EKD18171.1 hypothetical protein MBM_03943 [Drepanopeziza brunnea f. sp. 'multigermtubi' MB_m1]KAJ5037480.1 hypothetical protein L3040_007654 [Drepanopeziza brunnea f. sp. 'multigermtubi']
MAHFQTIHLEHLPPSHDLHIALYHKVTNAAFLHQQLLAGNTDFEYALVDASVILSKLHILAAAYRAVNDMLENRLRSRNVHSEMVFSLSPNNNIAESFRRFGLTPTTSSLLVLKLSTPTHPFLASAVQAHLASAIDGEAVPLTDDSLRAVTDVARVRKLYKLNAAGAGGGGGGKKKMKDAGVIGGVVDGGRSAEKEEEERRELEVLVLGAMALRSVTN